MHFSDVNQAASKWIGDTLQKRDCVKFIPSTSEIGKCGCGQPLIRHRVGSPHIGVPSEGHWNPIHHTRPSPTDSFGTLEFQGGPHPSKAQYARLSFDTRPEIVMQLLTRQWGVSPPKMLITVHGGKANFDVHPRVTKLLRHGLVKAAKTTSAWIVTDGINTGVTYHIGEALISEQSPKLHAKKVISIGILPWGMIQNNKELLGCNTEVSYHAIAMSRSRFAVLNPHLRYFLLADNGTIGKYGGDFFLRRKLEKFISHQNLPLRTMCHIPLVCLLIEGGISAIRVVLEYVTDSPAVPVVVFDGSGRAADLIAFAFRCECGAEGLESIEAEMMQRIQNTFEVGLEQARKLFVELLGCIRNRNMITIFRLNEQSDSDDYEQDLDQVILRALLKSPNLSPSDQLNLALTWNRVDIARSEIFVYGCEWQQSTLEEAMMYALSNDRLEFVKLLLENGVLMKKFLTIRRLEELYNMRGPPNTLRYIVRDVRPNISPSDQYSLLDIGLVVNKLMGGAFRYSYTKRKFRLMYQATKHVMASHPSYMSSISKDTEQQIYQNKEQHHHHAPVDIDPVFEYPFNELLIWAVLTKRHSMALLMWHHGEEALAKALVACKLYKALANEAAEDDLEAEISDELSRNAAEFEHLALEFLDFCYRQDDEFTEQLLTFELQNWSSQTCLSLAVSAVHRKLMSHPCCQVILADLWMGGLRTRRNTNVKVILGIFVPPTILSLEFKSKEELQQMPQTEEEHLIDLMESNSISRSSSTPDSDVNFVLSDDDLANDTSIKSDNASDIDVEIPEVGGLFRVKSVDSNGYSADISELATVKKKRPLRLKKKFYEFYAAPITKFWTHAISYVIFLFVYSCVILVDIPDNPSWAEWYVISVVVTMGFEKIREILTSEPVQFRQKVSVWMSQPWFVCDAVAVAFFLCGFAFRINGDWNDIGRLMYCVDVLYWYIRILKYISVNKYFGPLVTMIGEMVKNMVYFVALLLVILMAFGVFRQAVLYPNLAPNWNIVKDVFYQPYFMLYGEVFADDIDPECGIGGDSPECVPGRWLSPLVMSAYLLIANILLINLLIAVFNNIFTEVNSVSQEVYMFQRYAIVMEYERKPLLPEPLIVFNHLYLIWKYCLRRRGTYEIHDNGLKLFLSNSQVERLYDFEEEYMELCQKEKESRVLTTSEERIRTTKEKLDAVVQKLDDLTKYETALSTAVEMMEVRMQRLEELGEDVMNGLRSINRSLALAGSLDVNVPVGQDHTHMVVPDMSDNFTLDDFRSLRRKTERSFSLVSGSDNPSSDAQKTASQFPVYPHQHSPQLHHLSSQSFSSKRSRRASEVVNQHLRHAEESDYQMMEGLIQRRLCRNSENLAVSLEELCSLGSDSSSESTDSHAAEPESSSVQKSRSLSQ